MLTITDCRKTNECRLKDIEPTGFFKFGDVLCRRVMFHESELTINVKNFDAIIFIEMPSGEIGTLDRETIVEYIPSKYLNLYIED